MSFKEYLKESLYDKKSIYSSKPIPENLIDVFKQNLCWKSRSRRDYCGVISSALVTDLEKMGIDAKRIEGYFLVDKPDLGLKSFTDEEIEEMKSSGYDIYDEKSRLKFAKDNKLLDELRKIPHYWIYTKEFGIIDASVNQFKKFMNGDISDSNYVRK